jgi:hypothetical protein
MIIMAKLNNLAGQKFGDLLVIQKIQNYIYPSGKSEVQWECLCDCGNKCNKTTNNLLHSKKVNLHCGCKPKNYVDKTGQKFGRLTVLRLSDIKNQDKNGHPIFTCLCDCGNQIDISSDSLRKNANGGTKSCGCLNKELASKLGKSKIKNLINQRFGRLTVMHQAENKINKNNISLVQWFCKCDCGNEIILDTGKLISGNTKSCGCLFKEKCNMVRNNIIGNRYGKLVVINRDKNTNYENSRAIKYKCKCDCGNIVSIPYSSLTAGHSLSCGCLQKELISKRSVKDITGQKFGKLLVLEREGTTNDRKAKWRCKCDCGTICIVSGKQMRTGKIMSCGCIKSLGENYIKDILTSLNIKFVQQYKFSHCKDKVQLPFDFYLPDYNICIEYQGEQHYKPVDFAGKGIEWARKNFLSVQNHDKIKKDYCLSHNIKFLEIPYWDFDDIENILKQKLKI